MDDCRVTRRASSGRTINVLVSSFAGLSLPRTTCIPFSADLGLSSVLLDISNRLPCSQSRHNTTLTTIDNQLIDESSTRSLSSLLGHDDDFITLQLRGHLRGGKGGFGSQLRAAGGRMSSRKKRNQQDVNGSNRNLDGRRLRTITEAKNLAEYLAMKPDMDRKEREERRKRWEAVVELAEKKEDEMRDGKNNVRLDGDWVDAKEEAEAKTRDAVMAAMRASVANAESTEAASDSSIGSASAGKSQSEAQSSSSRSSPENVKVSAKGEQTKTFFGWDDDDEDMSDDDDEVEMEPVYKGKGKAKAKAKA